MKRLIIVFSAALSLLVLSGCAKPPTEINQPPGEPSAAETPESAEPDVDLPDKNRKTDPDQEIPDDSEPERSIPYLPETPDPFQVYPSFFRLNGSFDTSMNNRTLDEASFWINPELFYETPVEHASFLVFDSPENSEIGPCRISVLAEPVADINVHAQNEDGTLHEVLTLNTQLDEFLGVAAQETYTYFSEEVRGHYIPGAMFQSAESIGFIIFFADQDTVYSLQFLCFDSDYADAQMSTIAELIDSILLPE